LKPTAVYLIQSESDPELFKVGLSDHVPRRRGQVRVHYNLGGSTRAETWFPTRLGAQDAERAWHLYLAPFRDCPNGGREWFRMQPMDVQCFLHWSEQSNSSLPLRSSIKSGRMTPYQSIQLTSKLLRSIPNGRQVQV
jgi:hypothetical protein